MTDFSTLSYTSAREIPTLLYTCNTRTSRIRLESKEDLKTKTT